MKPGFLEKLIGRLGRIGPEDVQNYLLRLAQEKGFLETIFNSIQEGIIVTDAKGRITYLNDSACEIFGLDGENSIGKPLGEQVRGLDWNALSQSDAALSRDMKLVQEAEKKLHGQGRVLLRYSGTEAKIRLLIEGRDSSQIDREADRIAEAIQRALGE